MTGRAALDGDPNWAVRDGTPRGRRVCEVYPTHVPLTAISFELEPPVRGRWRDGSAPPRSVTRGWSWPAEPASRARASAAPGSSAQGSAATRTPARGARVRRTASPVRSVYLDRERR